jgi:hypothetical protein
VSVLTIRTAMSRHSKSPESGARHTRMQQSRLQIRFERHSTSLRLTFSARCKRPVYRILGGSTRSKVRAYSWPYMQECSVAAEVQSARLPQFTRSEYP